MHDLLRIGSHVTALPVIHGSGDFAWQVRQVLLNNRFDCVAVPLPGTFQEEVEEAIERLPTPSIVLQRELNVVSDDQTVNYVPVDPCQPVISALRFAMGEHIDRHFIDLETQAFESHSSVLPDSYALKKVPIHRFSAAVLPVIGRVPAGQPQDRVDYMAYRLRQLEKRYESILFVCSLLDWPWIRESFGKELPEHIEPDPVAETESYGVTRKTSIFLMGELPFVTGLYERARSELEEDDNLSVDGVKELLIAARTTYRAEMRKRARKITPQLLMQCLKYIRNLSLLESRLTPDLYTIVVAAKQVLGDQYARHVAEVAREYPYADDDEVDAVEMGIGRARLPDEDVVSAVSRLPGPPVEWRSCHLQRAPEETERQRWKMKWNPFSQCSYPPEDELIENFRAHVFDRAKAIMGADLARTEKFTTSVMDGIDIRDTLRHWYDGEIYVKILPPTRGRLDCVVMLFDAPADPRDYPWRTTWFAEHQDESTLAFFASDFRQELVGPGIGMATYGGAMFLFPPVMIRDVWRDPKLDFTETLEERLIASACLHSQCPHIAVLSPLPPGPGWRRLAKRYKKTLVHVPLGQFGDATVQQLRMVHVLNGKEVRSYAARFIRRA